ncbi:DNA-3-methyladenine glycosylase family protein [Myceligenerans xiligouense]|nr:DNA-3-methyladenine glycosylase [Myceligenerans xiligouense]
MVHHVSARPLDVGLTLGPLGHGPFDPAFHRAGDGSVWRTTLTSTGPVTQRFMTVGPREVLVHLWGDGAPQSADELPILLGEDEDTTGFAPPAKLRDAQRRATGLRLVVTGMVLEALVPAVLEQRVQTPIAHRAWRRLLARYGLRAPGPAPAGMRVVPDARTWARIPEWDWHRAGIDPARARTITRCAAVAPRLEEASAMPRAEARSRLERVVGVGAWTSAETAQRAFGDADAVSVGDFHLAATVGWVLTGRRTDDVGMLRLLDPYTPYRHRLTRLVLLDHHPGAPRRGPRRPLSEYRAF